MDLTREELRKLARTTPAGYAWYASSQLWIPAPHLLLLSQKIADAAAGRITRLAVFMPPRHGKSELISKYAPAWFLGNYPDKKVMLASYADTFAAQWGRKARDSFAENAGDLWGLEVEPETAGGQLWEVKGRDGVMVTAGVGGGLTGKGAHLLIIDDPVKNQIEAFSETTRDSHHDWWKSTARTRLQPGGSVILVMTRWHEDDLAGRLIKDMLEEDGDTWEILSLPGIAEAPAEDATDTEGQPYDPSIARCSVSYPNARTLDVGPDPLGRAPGKALWPEWYDIDWLNGTRKASGTYWFNAMYQQKPSESEGNFFKRADFRYFEPIAPGDPLVRIPREGGIETYDTGYGITFMTVDAAETEKKSSDYTVCSTWSLHPATKELLLLDRRRAQFDPTRAKHFVRTAIQENKPAIVYIEKKSAGTAILSELLLEGYPIVGYVPDADKVTRALVAVARYGEHRILHPRGVGSAWVAEEWEPELLGFPNATHDDQVDTVSLAAIKLVELAGLPVGTGGSTMKVRTGAPDHGDGGDKPASLRREGGAGRHRPAGVRVGKRQAAHSTRPRQW